MLADPATVAPNFSAAAPAVEPITPENGYFGRVTPLDNDPGAPLFQPVATAPAKTADEALAVLADEIADLAQRGRDAHCRLFDLDKSDAGYDALGTEATALDKGATGRLTMAALVRSDTSAGLAAKGRAVLALREVIEGCETPEADSMLFSMAEDAVRLAAAAPAAATDAKVIALAKRVGRLARMELRAFGRVSDLEDKVDDMLPLCRNRAEAQQAADAARQAELAKIGNVLDYRMNDPVFTEACERAGAAAEKARAPFLAACAARDAERADMFREIGAEVAAQRQSRLGNRLEAAGHQLAAMKPRTLAGCSAMAGAAKAAAATGLGSSSGWTNALYEAVAHAVAQLRVASPATSTVVRPSAPDHLALESYRTWLAREHAALTHEMYPGVDEAFGSVFLNNPGGRFHFRGEPPASTRAERILAIVGVDWRRDPVAEIDRQHERAA